MENFETIGRHHWEKGEGVAFVRGGNACRDYFEKSSRGFQIIGLPSGTDVSIIHRYIKAGNSQIDFMQLPNIDFSIEQLGEFDYYYLKLVISGRCELSIDGQRLLVEEGQAAMVNPIGALSARWSGACEQVMIRIDRAILEQTLMDELDIELSAPIIFPPAIISAAQTRPVVALIDLALRDADSAAIFGTWRLGRQFERLLHLAVLQCLPNNYTEMVQNANSQIAPYYVRRVEEFLRANYQKDVTITDLVAVANISKRSLFYGFQRWRNVTPMAYLKKLRLDVARTTLRTARQTNMSVTDVATSVGYWHLSRFSNDYKARFGELPSVTLQRS